MDHRELMLTAVAREGEAHRAALRGDVVGAQVAYRRAVEAYRASWEAAPPEAYGRLIGLVKASYREAVLAIVHDFEGREEHLTGVAFADTAAMLETLAAPRGLAAGLASAALPPLA